MGPEYMNSGSVWESLSQLIFRDITYRIYVWRFIMNLNVFHKTNKMKLSTDEYTQQCWVKGQGWLGWGWFRASFLVIEGRVQETWAAWSGISWSKKSRSLEIGSIWRTLEHYDGHHNSFFEKNIRFPSLDFFTTWHWLVSLWLRDCDC